MMYGVGIIGCGGMGSGHAARFASFPDAQVVACADVVEERAQRLAAEHGARAYGDGRRLLADRRVDIAVICTPTPFHAPLIEAAAKRGKHIFSEKPLARTLAEARRAIAAAEEAGVRLMVGHVLRFFPEYALAKRLLDEGAVGRPAVARTARCSGHPQPPADWYGDYAMSGGVLVDMAIHDIDFLLWCFGPAERVYCKALTHRGPALTDYGLVTVRFRNRVIAHVEGSWAHTPGIFYTQLEIAGDRGLIEYDSDTAVPLRVWRKPKRGSRAPAVVVPESPLADSPYAAEVREFMDCVRTGRQPSVTPEDAYRALEVALAAEQSTLRGEVVALPLA
ncbi:MAG TPA: Gfo/Idh/MocA family oxidoreductase [Armatimonadota bacterium]|nr:Gfo/Idh/MocA family oxidoreductase [Armatimonadota bacterium]